MGVLVYFFWRDAFVLRSGGVIVSHPSVEVALHVIAFITALIMLQPPPMELVPRSCHTALQLLKFFNNRSAVYKTILHPVLNSVKAFLNIFLKLFFKVDAILRFSFPTCGNKNSPVYIHAQSVKAWTRFKSLNSVPLLDST